MDFESRKYKVIEKLLKVNEEETLYRLESLLNEVPPRDIWDELPAHIQQALDISIEQSIRGDVKPHDEVMAQIKKKYNIA